MSPNSAKIPGSFALITFKLNSNVSPIVIPLSFWKLYEPVIISLSFLFAQVLARRPPNLSESPAVPKNLVVPDVTPSMFVPLEVSPSPILVKPAKGVTA